jgi:PAS domain S-box-containing protein
MNDEKRDKENLLNELRVLRKRVVELEDADNRKNQLEKKVENIERRFNIVTNNLYTWELWIGSDNRLLYVSPSCDRITGYQADEFMEDSNLITNIAHPDDRDDVVKHHYSKTEQENTSILNFRILTRGGELRWIQSVCRSVYDDDGNWQGRRYSCRNVTEHKIRDEALREKEAQYREIFNSATDAFMIFDAEGNIVDANPQACKVYGYSYEEIITLSYKDHVHSDYIDNFKLFQKEKTEKGEFQSEAVDIKKDGTLFNVEVRGAEIDYKGKKHLLGIVRDVTERKRVEQQIRESEERFREMAENINEVFWLMSVDQSKTLYISPGYEKIWGRTCESLYENPKSFLDAVCQEDRGLVNNSNIKQGRDITYSIVRPDGSNRWVRDRAFPIYNEQGEVYRVAGIAEDITAQKIVEEKLAEYQKQLQAMASNVSLAEEKERRQIASWLHDQIGPNLAISRIKLGTLRKSLIATDSYEILNDTCGIIEETIDSVRSLTFELSPPVLYELGLEAAIEWITEKFNEQQDIAFEFEDDMNKKSIENDLEVLLFQAVRELLLNVTKHSRANKAKVSICKDGSDVLIMVEDDGVGFVFPKSEKLWEKVKGFGLFSIQERLIPLGGDIKIKTTPGSGTRVTLRAPIKSTTHPCQ